MVLLDAHTQQLLEDVTIINNGIRFFAWLITGMLTIIGGLLIYIWRNSDKKHDMASKRQDDSDDKFTKLAEEVTKLTIYMNIAFPQIEKNTNKINEMDVNCAKNNHRKKST